MYNAHLSAYGQLGPVEAGDVIGYVGATGDAGANHDHFEWHPSNGPRGGPVPVPDGGLLARLIGHRQGIIDRSH